MWDNWQNQTRLLRGTNAGSDAVVASFNMHTKQVAFPAYNSVSAFAGTAVANLAVDSNGNILTVSTSGGSVFPYTGIASINGGLIVTGSITASSAIHAQANGAMYFRGGDDAEFWDINVTNTVGIYGQQDQGVASIKLGSNGGTISGRSGSIGIGTIIPNSASLHVNGNVFATSFTGSLLGTASFATSSSQTQTAITASYALNADLLDGRDSSVFATTGSNQFSGSQTITGSLTVTGQITAQTLNVQQVTSSIVYSSGSNVFGSSLSNTQQLTGSVSVTGSFTVTTTGTELQVTSTGVNLGNITTDVHNVTGSLRVSGSSTIIGNTAITGSTNITGSLTVTTTGTELQVTSTGVNLGNIATDIHNVTGSLLVSGSMDLRGNARVTGSFNISGSARINGDTFIGNPNASAIYTTQRVASTTAGVNTIYSLATSSYDGVFVDYTIRSGSVGRAGNFMAMWSGSSADFTDNSINGFGITTNFVFGASISGSNLIVSGSGSTAGWTVKTIIRGI
jgi:hypothetical protein